MFQQPRLEKYQNRFFSYFWEETYVVGTHWKRLDETLPMSITTNVFMEK